LLSSLSDEQITTPHGPANWSIKDEIAHLWAWQQRSLARLKAAQHNQEPQFPVWSPIIDPELEDNTDPINTWIYETHRDQPWAQVYQRWQAGFHQILDEANAISERDLLDASKYPWLQGHPLAFVLIGSYDHHQEHLEELMARLQ
jgi:alkanesulfonate monooxygenase SsuD/methylene tetrahydromethanopterin reductase-like flavin-dependent oxidoreductase (luciferase family)